VLTFAQLQDSMLVKGPKTGSPNWDTQWRGFRTLSGEAFWPPTCGRWRTRCGTSGVEYLVLDGSFVEQKDHPNDIDACFPIARENWVSGRVELGLNRNRSEHVWTWDPGERYKSKDPRAPHPKLPFWHKYRIDLWPDYGQGAIDHEHLGWLTFEQAFRRTRAGHPKGIVKVLRPGQ
jgi:hypothetical protein